MITRFLTEVSTTFNPFRRRSKNARLFLTFLPANARDTMQIRTTMLPRESEQPSALKLLFKDGKEMDLDTETLTVKEIMEEVDRHSRKLARVEALGGG
ncbi:MAG: 39S ribosomal protein L44, mitochondrial [Phylliscum demangeonii]|nr:MAG: 39S ribosomal protein L44, mitochondrial [Phylliscum demangeonii]